MSVHRHVHLKKAYSSLTQWCQCLLLLWLSLTVMGCDPEALVNSYFEQMGLTRLSVLRTDVQPGTIILMDRNTGFVLDSFLDYVDDAVDSSHNYPTFGGSAQPDIHAKLPEFTGQTNLSGTLALKFLTGVFQLGPDFQLGLAGKVKVQIPDMKVRKMSVPSFEDFLKHEEAEPFERKVRQWIQQGRTPYLAYEVFRAKTIHVLSDQGQDVAPSLTIATMKPLPVSGEVGVAYQKVSSTELQVTGHRYFAFAVKTARLSWDVKNQSVVVNQTDRAKPDGRGAKGVPGDEYAAPLLDKFQPVTLQSGLPPEF